MKKTAFLLALIIAASGMISACSQSAPAKEDTNSAVQEADTGAKDEKEGRKTEKDDAKGHPAADGQVNGGSFTNLGSVSVDGKIGNCSMGGIIYSEGEKYGVVSYDGKHDTGLVYDYATSVTNKPYVKVFKKGSDGKDINTCGLVNAECKEIIEPKYAVIDVMNDRYIKVITGDKETDSKDEALFYSTDKMFSMSAEEGDTLYTGKWEVFDVENNKLIDGVSGTKAYRTSATGQFLKYIDDSEKEHYIDGSYKEIDDKTNVLSDGKYIVKSGSKCELYSEDGKKLFDYNSDDFNISSTSNDGEGFLASNYADGKTVYFIVDKTGKKISADYDNFFSAVYESIIYSDNKIYDYNGKELIPGEWRTPHLDLAGKEAFSTNKDSAFIIFNKDGKVVYQDDKYDDSDHYSHNDFAVAEKDEENNLTFYNFKEQRFSLEGKYLEEWFITSKADYGKTCDVIDTRTGKTVIEGYYSYTPYKDTTAGKLYILAYPNDNDKKTADVYVIG